ncbi:hypothetical protein [Specibacter sp. RAF43]|uniref:hypothetical protein n=1 Tax=Specibacter sp. RAF43 TaxID=3233057 RepID=UPI003F9D66E9
MGTTDRPGSSGDSTPTGPSHLDQHPGRRPEDDEPRLTDDQLAALIATDPLAHEPWAGFSAAELAWHLAAGSFAEEDPGAELSDADIARLIATAPPTTTPPPPTTPRPPRTSPTPSLFRPSPVRARPVRVGRCFRCR